ncbi:MAG: sn-glycerol-3-phosphate ABC transporter ATP-binding protein UgpC [Clostridiales bacterium]|nr:sn-glycerol-3-phosphate ABC transporter ATP-binding protein UgpC [Clostridiales bacterium]
MDKVSLRHVWKIYPNAKNVAPAVQDFNLDIRDGEFMVLVGASGCGKTTTLRMIAGLESITKGEILIDGKVVNDLSPRRRNIAMVFQNYALYPNLTLLENMAFGLRLRKMEKYKINDIVSERAKKLEIDHLMDRLPKDVSGGQRQRVALGRAIVRDPSVFLMDEPLSNLDAKMRVQMRTEITRIHRELGATTVYVTHDQTEAMTMGNRIVVMKAGLIQQVGTPEEIFNEPANRYVAGFIGTPPMNFIGGRLIRTDKGFAFSNAFMLMLIPEEKLTPTLVKYADHDLIGAIRPDYMTAKAVNGKGKNMENGFYGTLELSELVGADRYLHVRYNQQNRSEAPVVIRASIHDRYDEGTRLLVQADMNMLLFFDINSGKRIL